MDTAGRVKSLWKGAAGLLEQKGGAGSGEEGKIVEIRELSCTLC